VIGFRFKRRNLVFWAGFAALFAVATASAQTPAGYTINTIAGIAGFSFGYSGDGGPATAAQFWGLFSVTVDSSGNLYIADQLNDRIRKITAGTINTIAGDGTAGYAGDAGPAIDAELNEPTFVALDSNGNVYIVDYKNSVIRQVISNGDIYTVAGDNGAGAGYSGDNGAAVTAQLNLPISMAFDSSNNMYIADTSNNRIRKVTSVNGTITYATACETVSGGTTSSTNCPQITTLAGSTLGGYQGDGGPAIDALLNTPIGICVDKAGNVYFSDSSNHVIRKIATNGLISTVVGNGNPGFAGDGGPATQAELHYPKGIAMDQQGNLYIADYTNQVIRKVNTSGIIETIAGTPGIPGLYGDGGLANLALLNFPTGVAVDNSGNVYIADNQNYVVRKLTPIEPGINNGGVVTASAFGEFGAAAPGSWIEIYGSALAIDSRSWNNNDFSGVIAPTSLDGTMVTIGGQAAVIDYISPGQVNAQVPYGVTPGSQPLVVTTTAGVTSTYTVTMNATEPGLFAPANFLIGGKQYVAAVFPGQTDSSGNPIFVLPPNTIPGYTSRLANPGDTIVLYGVGFGAVTPAVPSGQIVEQNSTVSAPVAFSFGGTPAAAPSYAGLVQGSVGLYQFNVTVPTVPANNLTPLTFTQGGTSGSQSLYIAIGSGSSGSGD
jgi:uncharacterized protein (TIGR03437 family)